VITDPLPRQTAKRDAHLRSDRLTSLPLPPGEPLQAATQALSAAMSGGQLRPVRAVCADLLGVLARFYAVTVPDVRVLGVRPHVVTRGVCTYQLFGDYTPSTQRIRVWMRTAIREKVSSSKALLNTLLHEFSHHLDATHFACPDSPHTRGFFTRIDHLYHLALGTPAERRRPLHWIKRGAVWTIDWRRSRTRDASPPATSE
jgi:hypothetical protein